MDEMDDGIRRVLIDADYGADGIWWVLTSDEMKAPTPQGSWSRHPPRNNDQRSTPAWPQLSDELRDELKRWNDEMMDTAPSATSELSALRERGRVLANRVQQQLGEGFEVLYPFGTRIYRVDPPGDWAIETWEQELLGYPKR
jgi:hypothetical protein